MTATATPIAPASTTMSATSGHLPKWAPWALLLGCFAVSAVIFALANSGGDPADFNIALTLVVGLALLVLAAVRIVQLTGVLS